MERHAEELEQAVQQAVAQAEAAQRRLTFLAEASTLLASSLDYEATLRTVARLAVPQLADFALVHLVEGGDLRFVAAVHADPVYEAVLNEVARSYRPADNPRRTFSHKSGDSL